MIVLGNFENPNIKITPTSSNNSEGWFQAAVEIKVDCFFGKISVYLENIDLLRFHSQLIKLDKTLKGKAVLIPTEEQFTLILTGDGLGHINVTGHAYELASHGSCLKFDFELDQTYLPDFIDSIKSSLA